MDTVQEMIAANMPAPEMLKEYLEATGEELPKDYVGSNQNIHLAELFVELLEHDLVWIYDAKEPIPYLELSLEEYVGMMTRRFRLTEIEHNVLKGNYNMLEDKIHDWISRKYYTNYEFFIYFTLIRYVYRHT